MTKLSVWHNNGEFGTTQEVVVVADDEEYWFEPSVGTNSLTVGKKTISPWMGAVQPALHTQHGGNATLSEIQRPRLHIFNLARVEVLK